MSIFKKFFEEDSDFEQYEKDKIMARETISRWGEKVKLYSCDVKNAGGYYNEYVYQEDNIELVYSELEGLFIIYKDEKVLGYAKEIVDNKIVGSKIYIPGPWEYRLNEIYTKVLKSSYNKDKERSSYENGLRALHLIDSIGEAYINDSLRIEKDAIRLNDNSLNITYNVYKDDELVFSGSYLPSNREKIYAYEQGDWENEIKDYIKTLFVRREMLKQEENAKSLKLKK